MDLLQMKIEKAKAELPQETLSAIDAVDWKQTILGIRERKGYTFEQLGDLEIETELLLCGLLNPADYPKELETRMGLPRTHVDSLVAEMNELVFKKIKEELIKITQAAAEDVEKHTIDIPRPINSEGIKKVEPNHVVENIPEKKEGGENDILKQAGIEIMPPELASGKAVLSGQSLSTAKLNDSFKIPKAETEYTLTNMSKNSESSPSAEKTPPAHTAVPKPPTSQAPKIDPYRMPIE